MRESRVSITDGASVVLRRPDRRQFQTNRLGKAMPLVCGIGLA
jgi:hypothetical protein